MHSRGDPDVKLPQLSIATKLYAIFALLATVTVGACAPVAVSMLRQHAALTAEFEAAFTGAPACRAHQRADLRDGDGDPRHLPVADVAEAEAFATSLGASSTSGSARRSKDWQLAACGRTMPSAFARLSGRVRGIAGIPPRAGRGGDRARARLRARRWATSTPTRAVARRVIKRSRGARRGSTRSASKRIYAAIDDEHRR